MLVYVFGVVAYLLRLVCSFHANVLNVVEGTCRSMHILAVEGWAVVSLAALCCCCVLSFSCVLPTAYMLLWRCTSLMLMAASLGYLGPHGYLLNSVSILNFCVCNP